VRTENVTPSLSIVWFAGAQWKSWGERGPAAGNQRAARCVAISKFHWPNDSQSATFHTVAHRHTHPRKITVQWIHTFSAQPRGPRICRAGCANDIWQLSCVCCDCLREIYLCLVPGPAEHSGAWAGAGRCEAICCPWCKAARSPDAAVCPPKKNH